MRLRGLIAAAALLSLIAGSFGYAFGTGRFGVAGPSPAAAQSPGDDQEKKAEQGGRKVLYYRNPMGAPDTSPAPKKDSMGMDYIPVYAGDEPEGNTVRVSLDKVQRTGVRTEAAELRRVTRSVRAVGTVKVDERRLKSITLRAESYIEKLYVNATGQDVKQGEPLFRLYSPSIVSAQVDYRSAMNARGGRASDFAGHGVDGAIQRLRNLEVPETHIETLRKNGEMPMALDWPSPITGTVLLKRAVEGQRVQAGQEVFRIADLSRVWVLAEVPEQDLELIRIGDPAQIVFKAFPSETVAAKVDFIYPALEADTRTAKVRFEVDNGRGLYRADMYADVTIDGGSAEAPKIAIPASAVIDKGSRQTVLVERGEGMFEPREVKTGRRGQDGYLEVSNGLAAGEKVVVSGNFLIDAESNMKAALQGFDPGGNQQPQSASGADQPSAPQAPSETPR